MPACLCAGQPMLVAFNAAQYAVQLERKTPAQVKDEYMAVLRAMFGAANVPEPISVSSRGTGGQLQCRKQMWWFGGCCAAAGERQQGRG